MNESREEYYKRVPPVKIHKSKETAFREKAKTDPDRKAHLKKHPKSVKIKK